MSNSLLCDVMDDQRFCVACGWGAFNLTAGGALCWRCGRPAYEHGPPVGVVRVRAARPTVAARQLDVFEGRDVRGVARQIEMFSLPPGTVDGTL